MVVFCNQSQVTKGSRYCTLPFNYIQCWRCIKKWKRKKKNNSLVNEQEYQTEVWFRVQPPNHSLDQKFPAMAQSCSCSWRAIETELEMSVLYLREKRLKGFEWNRGFKSPYTSINLLLRNVFSSDECLQFCWHISKEKLGSLLIEGIMARSINLHLCPIPPSSLRYSNLPCPFPIFPAILPALESIVGSRFSPCSDFPHNH